MVEQPCTLCFIDLGLINVATDELASVIGKSLTSVDGWFVAMNIGLPDML